MTSKGFPIEFSPDFNVWLTICSKGIKRKVMDFVKNFKENEKIRVSLYESPKRKDVTIYIVFKKENYFSFDIFMTQPVKNETEYSDQIMINAQLVTYDGKFFFDTQFPKLLDAIGLNINDFYIDKFHSKTVEGYKRFADYLSKIPLVKEVKAC